MRGQLLKILTKLLRTYLVNATIDLTPHITEIIDLIYSEIEKAEIPKGEFDVVHCDECLDAGANRIKEIILSLLRPK